MRLREQLIEVVDRHHLLKHPFYQAWTAGTLSRSALQHYARQYHAHVRAFPTYVSGVHSRCGSDLDSRQALLENLIEEERGERNHAALWLQFAAGIGVSAAEVQAERPDPATRHLVDTFTALTQGPADVGAAALFAYESQVPAIAEAKIDGLRRHFALSDAASLQFFTVHRELDKLHSETTAAIVERQATSVEDVLAGAERAALALWGFLDGVQAQAQRLAA